MQFETKTLTVMVLRAFYRGRDIVPAGSIVTLPRTAAAELIGSNKARLARADEQPQAAAAPAPTDRLVRVPLAAPAVAALTTDSAAPLVRRRK